MPIDVDYKDLFKFLVCSKENKECMTHRCAKYPKTSDDLRNYLYDILKDLEDGDKITFSQWTTTDRSMLVEQSEPVNDYVELIEEQLQKLTVHSFTAKAQSRYLKSRKENLDSSQALFLGDFAENFKFVVQDEVQGFHWNNLQCTLHPVVVYYKHENNLKNLSYCIISDDNSHDVATVFEVQRKVLADVKVKIPELKHVEYFTDGCAAQYKNRKNFTNLCHHKHDFDISACWSFFATGHGKQPCDGLGGTIKRIVSKTSLQ